MLSRFFFSRASHLRLLTLTISKPQCSKPIFSSSSSSSSPNPNLAVFFTVSRSFCSNHNNGDNNDRDHPQSNTWKITREDEEDGDSVFGEDEGSLAGIADGDDEQHQTWPKEEDYKGRSRDGHGEEKLWKKEEAKEGDVFADVDEEFGAKGGGDEWPTKDGYKPWDLCADEKEEGIGVPESGIVATERSEEEMRLEKEEKELKAILKGND